MRGSSGFTGNWRAVWRGQVNSVLVTVKVDGEIIGVDYAYHFGRRTHGIFRGYCSGPAWRGYGLGTNLYCQVVREAIERGSGVLDAGSGIFDYKRQLGARMEWQQSLVVVRSGWGTRLRVWAALRTAYLLHLLYSRLWVDVIAPRVGVVPKGCHRHLRYGRLAQIFRATHLPLFGRARFVEARCLSPEIPQACAKNAGGAKIRAQA